MKITTIRQQAKASDAGMQLTLAQIYTTGICVKKDYRIAREWMHNAAEQGNVIAQIALGRGYSEGLYGVKKDPVQAVFWHRKAAEQGHRFGQHQLGLFYDQGIGVEQERRVDVRTPDEGAATLIVVSVEADTSVAFVLNAMRELAVGS